MKDLKPSNKESLQVPPVMEELFPAGVVKEKGSPMSTENIKREWFKKADENKAAATATAQDMAFFVKQKMKET